MAVGAGSIKRASRISTDGAVSESVKNKDAEMAVIKKPARAKAVNGQNSATTKKTTAKSTKTNKQVLQNTANKVYHITEELPIYLL